MEEYKLKHVIGGTNGYTFKTLEECIYYYDEAYLKEDVANDLFYYLILIDKAIDYIEDNFYEVGGSVAGSDLPYQPIQNILDILKGEYDE